MHKTKQLVLLVEETGGTGEYHRPVTSHWQTLSHNVVLLALSGSRTHNISGARLHTEVVVNPTTIQSRARRPRVLMERVYMLIVCHN